MNVLIAGCGYVGSALAVELVAKGHRVWGLRRDARALPQGVIPIAADLVRRETLDVIDDAIDHVVYAASAADQSTRAYEEAYVRGPSNVIDALSRRARVRRFVFISSTAVYGQDDGSWVDEDAPTEPARESGRILLEAERIVKSAPFSTVVLRLAGIYGPDRTWLVRRVHGGDARSDVVGRTPRYGNRIHRDDCAGALRHLLELEAPRAVYLGVDDAPVSLSEVYAFVAELLGVEPPPPGDGDEGRGTNKRCDNARLKASGYALRVPSYREGYGPIVRSYLSQLRG